MSPTTRRLAAIACLGLAVAISQNSRVAVLLSDNFDADSSSTVLNFNAFINWTVDNGTVDYIREGTLDCVGPSGGCVDSDGSTNNAGRLVSRDVFDLPDGTTGTISVQASGSQRGVDANILRIGLVFPDAGSPLLFRQCLRFASDPYSDCVVSATAFPPPAA